MKLSFEVKRFNKNRKKNFPPEIFHGCTPQPENASNKGVTFNQIAHSKSHQGIANIHLTFPILNNKTPADVSH